MGQQRRWPKSWPPGGRDRILSGLQRRYLPDLANQDIAGLLRDPLLGRIAVVSSFGAESAVLLHYVAAILPGVEVIFLDTRMHFPETVAHRAALARQLSIRVIDITPSAAVMQETDPHGTLYRHDPNACCRLRKTNPLQDALAPFDTWVTGRKRFHGYTRAALPVLERNGRHIKINPLAYWTPAEITAYLHTHALPPHPLVARGFLSIGCAACTRAVAPDEDPRAGRWPQLSDKVECGIHLGPDGSVARSRKIDEP